ncbi:MAG: glycosyltransferase family 4 protein, partial [Bacteroidota bacterium]|nr:glycosyltransferase family 4 protein [Bacteroidota bacterium]
MKSVLIVTYYFPPSGGPGVQRVLKFTRYLRSFGWRPVVLTVRDADYPARDESLLREIPPDVPVYRTNIPEPYRFYRVITGKGKGTPVDVNTIPRPGERRPLTEHLAEFVRATFFIPDARMGWLRTAIREGLRIIDVEGVDALYSSSPPYTCALIARALKRRTGLPWVAGFRDPWRGFLSAPKRWFLPDWIERHMEYSVFRECDRMEVAWVGILKDFHAKYPTVPIGKVHHLPNGFDSADFPTVEIIEDKRFVVTYTGSLYGKRNPATFLSAVEKLARQGDVDLSSLRLQFIGRFGEDILRMLENPFLQPAVEVKGYLPHAESIRHLFQSHALLLIVDDYPGNEEIVPGKVYEYIGAGKPIIALAPPGAVEDVIRETRSGRVVRSDDVQGIARVFLEYYRAWRSGTLECQQDRDAAARY